MNRSLSALAALGLVGAAPIQPFRIAVVRTASAPCARPSASDPAGERAYFDLLTRRLERQVLACPVASSGAGATALAAGALDMAPLDPQSYAPVKAVARAAMTVRPKGGIARVLVLLAVMSGRDGAAASLRGRRVAFGGSSPVALVLPKEVLSEQGYGPGVRGQDLVTADEAAATAALRSGKAEAVALEAAAWQRQCQGPAKGPPPCADLKLVWRARPMAEKAYVVRRDLPDPVRYRILGVHMPMHMEDRAAFAWAAGQLGPDAADFEPAEALALEAARLR